MSTLPPKRPSELEEYRPYLRLLAELEIAAPLRRRIDPSDLVQEALLKACAAVRKDPERFSRQNGEMRAAWLRRILANTLANSWRDHRAARRDLQRECSLESQLDRSSVALSTLLPASDPTPSQHAMRQESVVQLAEALARLPDDQRRAVILQRVQGLPVAEIAEDLGCSKDAVAGLVRRGLERLERELGRNGP